MFLYDVVLPDPPLSAVDADVVLDWPGHGEVALHCKGDRHVDGAGHHDVVQPVQDVTEWVLKHKCGNIGVCSPF